MRVRAKLTEAAHAVCTRASVVSVFKSLFPFILVVMMTRDNTSVSAKPFAFQTLPGFSLARFAGTARARNSPVVKPYNGRRVSSHSLLMVYWHDLAVAVAELGPEKLLLSCDVIEVYGDGDREKLLRELSSINRPLEITFPQMLKLISQCEQVEAADRLDTGSRWADAQDVMSAAVGEERVGLLGAGSPLSLLQGIIPGTKWCGTGDIAANYHDLGAARRVDRCCRAHDLCPVKVRAYSERYNLTNDSLYSKSHCRCDDALFGCLKATNTSASQVMGNIYFNLVRVPCVDESNDGRIFRNSKKGF